MRADSCVPVGMGPAARTPTQRGWRYHREGPTPIPRDNWTPGRVYLSARLQDKNSGLARRDTRDTTFEWEVTEASAFVRSCVGCTNDVAL